MSMTNMPSEIRKAWGVLAEINDLLGDVIQWAGDDAVAAVNKLYDRWQNLCEEADSARSVLFYNRCKGILRECESFCDDVISKGQFFKNNAKDKISLIAQLAGDHKETRHLLEGFLELWNNVIQPQLVLLLANATTLMTCVMDIMDIAIEPIEA